MPWARLDDAFWRNPKVLAAGNEAAGLYARALSYSADNGTGGLLSLDTVKTLAGSRFKALSRKLVDVGLWDPSGQGGWHIHDYDDPAYGNPTSSRAQARSEAARKAAQVRWGNGPPDTEPDAERMPDASEAHSDPHAERNANGNADSMREDASRVQAGATPTPSPTQPPSSSSLSNPPEVSNARDSQPGGISEPIWRARKRAANGSAAALEGWDLDTCNRVARTAAERTGADVQDAHDRLAVLACMPETRGPGRLLEPAAWDWAGAELTRMARDQLRRDREDADTRARRAEHAATAEQTAARKRQAAALAEADPEGWAQLQAEAAAELEAEQLAPLPPLVLTRALDIHERSHA